MNFARLNVPDHQSKRITAVEPGVRQEDLPTGVDAVEQGFVQPIQANLIILQQTRRRTKAD